MSIYPIQTPAMTPDEPEADVHDAMRQVVEALAERNASKREILPWISHLVDTSPHVPENDL